MNFRDDYRHGARTPKDRPMRKNNTCPLCRQQVIWARIAGNPRGGQRGGRAFVPFPVERCAPGTGDISLTIGLFLNGEAPLAERVAIATTYRSHRDHCPELPKTRGTTPAAPAKAFSAAGFNKKSRNGGTR